MIAAYHKRLPPDLMQDLAKTRQEVERWATTDYTLALAKATALRPTSGRRSSTRTRATPGSTRS